MTASHRTKMPAIFLAHVSSLANPSGCHVILLTGFCRPFFLLLHPKMQGMFPTLQHQI